MPSRPENQHYVTAAYLEKFCPDGERALHVIRRRELKWFRERPRNIATRKNLYSLAKDADTFDDQVEHMLAQQVEGPGLKALSSLLQGETTPSWAARYRIAILLAFQFLRIPETLEGTRDIMSALGQGLTEHVISRPGELENFIKNREGKDAEEAVALAERIRVSVRKGNLKTEARREMGLLSFSAVGGIADIFAGKEWTVFHTDVPMVFTCDSPVYISSRSPMGEIADLSQPGATINFPLCSRRFLVMTHSGRSRELADAIRILPSEFVRRIEQTSPPVRYTAADMETLERLNSDTACCANEWVCGPASNPRIEQELGGPRLGAIFEVKRGPGGRVEVTRRMLHKKG